jgi:hypothetical protein
MVDPQVQREIDPLGYVPPRVINLDFEPTPFVGIAQLGAARALRNRGRWRTCRAILALRPLLRARHQLTERTGHYVAASPIRNSEPFPVYCFSALQDLVKQPLLHHSHDSLSKS